MQEYPRLWALVCISTETVEYTNTRFTAVKGMYNTLPHELRENFAVVRYDAFYKPDNNERKIQNDIDR